MDELERKRNLNALTNMVKDRAVSELTDKELVELINNTTDLNLLDRAEQEYVDRHCTPNNILSLEDL